MNPDITYELEVQFIDQSIATKEAFKGWLDYQGVHGYLEACRDNLDVSPVDYDPVLFEMESLLDPISIYRFEQSELIRLRDEAIKNFEFKIRCQIREISTTSWQDGWKDSFKPILTQKFVVLPPWETSPSSDKELIIIEPAMAFGTGQHPTTVLCLEAIEDIFRNNNVLRVLDIGTGTGVLAIACQKLGATFVVGTDIDHDSIQAALLNSTINKTRCHFQLGTFFDEQFDLIIANVLKPFFMTSFAQFPQSRYLVLSGFLIEDNADILSKAPSGYVLKDSRSQGDWSCLVLEHEQFA